MSYDIINLVFTNEELLALVQRELEIVQGFCLEEKRSFIPAFLQILDSTYYPHIIPLYNEKNFNKARERQGILLKTGNHFYHHWGNLVFPMVATLTSEAWMKAFHPDTIPHPDKVRMPSDYPDAVDSLVVQCVTLAKEAPGDEKGSPRAALGILEIKRRKPFMQFEMLVEPTLVPAKSKDATDLVNYFYLGWMQASMKDHNFEL